MSTLQNGVAEVLGGGVQPVLCCWDALVRHWPSPGGSERCAGLQQEGRTSGSNLSVTPDPHWSGRVQSGNMVSLWATEACHCLADCIPTLCALGAHLGFWQEVRTAFSQKPNQSLLRTYKPPSLFGEIALLYKENRAARSALCPCQRPILLASATQSLTIAIPHGLRGSGNVAAKQFGRECGSQFHIIKICTIWGGF